MNEILNSNYRYNLTLIPNNKTNKMKVKYSKLHIVVAQDTRLENFLSNLYKKYLFTTQNIFAVIGSNISRKD